MPNTYFQFKSFTVHQEHCAMKVTTDASLFGAWIASQLQHAEGSLDIGAGTGLLSLMAAQACSGKIDAVEIESTCFEQLRENIAASGWQDRIQAIHEDFKVFESGKKYGCIFSNPPFHQDQLPTGKTATDLARHQTGLTLDLLISKSRTLITDTGKFFLLVPFYRTDEVIEIAKTNGWQLFTVTKVRQSTQHNYFRSMLGFQLQLPQQIDESSLFIKNEDDQYSQDFIHLLRPYYLAF